MEFLPWSNTNGEARQDPISYKTLQRAQPTHIVPLNSLNKTNIS